MFSETLEEQYNARKAVPDHVEIFSTWQTRSERFRQTADCQLDLSYGSAPRERLDLFRSSDNTRLHLFLHGGYWQAMDKSYFSFIAEGLIRQGVSVAICNYPLCPESTLQEILHSVQKACAWLWKQSAELGGKWKNIQLSGHSAGGQLTAMLMATKWRNLDHQLPVDLITSGVAISGIYDLEPLLHTTINDKLGLTRETATENSPLFTEPATSAPLLLVVGGDERPAFHQQMNSFAEHRRSQNIRVETALYPELNHFTMIEQLADSDGRLLKSVIRLPDQTSR